MKKSMHQTFIQMNKQMKVSTLLRKSLLGIRVTPFTSPPLFRIANWEVYDAGKVDILPIEERNRNLNYQIQRGEKEKILVRMFLAPDKNTILKTNYYYILSNSDSEQSFYLVHALINRIGIPLSDDHQLNCFDF
jgi:hypothetical protein